MEFKNMLNEELKTRYEEVKKNSGMHDDKSVLALLISKEYNRIQRANRHRLFLPKETYLLVEKAAKARGQEIDEYVDELTEKMLKEAKEGVKHEN